MRTAVLVLVLVLVSVGLYGGWMSTKTLWPGLHSDACLLSTVVINRANGQGNTFDSYTRYLHLRNGNRQFNFHGQLYYPILAATIPGKGYEQFLRVLHWSNLVAFVISLFLFSQVARSRLRASLTIALLCGVSAAFAIVSALQYLQGRPDHGVVLVLLLFCLLEESILRGRGRPLLVGVMTGVVAAISPFPGYVTGATMVLAGLLDVDRASRSTQSSSWLVWVANSSLSLIVALLCWWSLMALAYPWPLADLFQRTVSYGVRDHAGLYSLFHGLAEVNLPRMAESWVRIKYIPFVFLPLLYATILVLINSARTMVSSVSWMIRVLLLLLLILISGQLWFFAVSWPEINYGLICLLPGILYWSLCQSARLDKVRDLDLVLQEHHRRIDYKIGVSTHQIKMASVVLFSLLAIVPGLGYLRTTLLQRAVHNRGVDFKTANNSFQRLKQTLAEDEYILISEFGASMSGRSSIVFDGPPWRSRASVFGDDLNRYFNSLKPKYYFNLQDSMTDTNVPQQVFGYKLIESNLTPAPVKVFGLRVGSVTPGYGYVVYEKVNEEGH
ncbi:MAG: hypothetical protein EBU88_09585 [Acidobacteria bacterium]|nr:hypothetical protein [Acidobacteriota bacterium]